MLFTCEKMSFFVSATWISIYLTFCENFSTLNFNNNFNSLDEKILMFSLKLRSDENKDAFVTMYKDVNGINRKKQITPSKYTGQSERGPTRIIFCFFFFFIRDIDYMYFLKSPEWCDSNKYLQHTLRWTTISIIFTGVIFFYIVTVLFGKIWVISVFGLQISNWTIRYKVTVDTFSATPTLRMRL